MANGNKNNQQANKKAGKAAYERLSGHPQISVFASNVGSIALAKAGQRVHSYNQDLMQGLLIGSIPVSRKDAFDSEVKELMDNIDKSLSKLRKLTRNAKRTNRPTASATKKKVAKKAQQKKQENIKKAAEKGKQEAA